LNENFQTVLRDHTAGDPMREDVKWTNLSRRQMSRKLKELGTPAGKNVVSQLLYDHGYRRRKPQKKRTMGQHADRNAQFERIAELKQEYLEGGKPVISIDTKKKEMLGNFHRDGVTDGGEPTIVNDHDFASQSDGKVIPHGIYDLRKNEASLHLNASCDTTEFACESTELWWHEQGQYDYPDADELLILCDGGGSNSASAYIFKEDLQGLSNRLGLKIRVAHYDHITRGTTRSMFETLLKRQWDLERYRSAPYADERERFLLNLQERGYARDRLQGLNRLLLSVAQNVRLDGVEKFSVSQLSATARQWIQNESDRGGSEKSRRCRELDFLFVAKEWFSFLNRIDTGESREPFHSELQQFLSYLCTERGFAEATIENRQKSLSPFFDWLSEQGLPLSHVGVNEISTYQRACACHGWKRTTISFHVQSLRGFFRYAASQGRTSPAIACASFLVIWRLNETAAFGQGTRDLLRCMLSHDLLVTTTLNLFRHAGKFAWCHSSALTGIRSLTSKRTKWTQSLHQPI
jgi:hypothetical protein